MNKFEVFKEIVIGGLTKKQLLMQLSESGIQFNKYASILFDRPQFLPSPLAEKVNLVKVTLADLGLDNSCSFAEFGSGASALELKLYPLYLVGFRMIGFLHVLIDSTRLRFQSDSSSVLLQFSTRLFDVVLKLN